MINKIALPSIKGGRKLKLLASWIHKGRRESWFKQDCKPVTVNSYKGYVKSIERSGWKYECKEIYVMGRPIGYFDFKYKNGIAEILGLYLEKRFRGKGVGFYVLSWLLRYLKDLKIKRVKLDIYSHNLASIKLCSKAGFSLAGSKPEGSRKVLVYELNLKNTPQCIILARLHKAIGEYIAKNLNSGEIKAILGAGSIARNFADAYSVIDLVVIVSDSFKKAKQLAGEHQINGFDIDITVVGETYLKQVASSLDPSLVQVIQESVVLYCQKGFKRVIRKIQKLSKAERREKLISLVFEIGWLGFIPKSWRGKYKYGYRWYLPYDLPLRRGFPLQGDYIINHVLDLILQLLFYLNWKYPASPKWRLVSSFSLPILPQNFEEKIKKFYIEPNNFIVKANILTSFVEDIVKILEDEKILQGNVYKEHIVTGENYIYQ